jgi:N-methylhydantoinase B
MFSDLLAGGELCHHVQAGGGGRGDPLDRDPERVLADVKNEKVSEAAARSQYGVVFDPGLHLDEEHMAQLRALLRVSRS